MPPPAQSTKLKYPNWSLITACDNLWSPKGVAYNEFVLKFNSS